MKRQKRHQDKNIIFSIFVFFLFSLFLTGAAWDKDPTADDTQEISPSTMETLSDAKENQEEENSKKEDKDDEKDEGNKDEDDESDEKTKDDDKKEQTGATSSIKKIAEIYILQNKIKNGKYRENWPPPPPSMDRMKTKGCVADGLLTGYGKEGKNIRMINRSECEYIHRAIETWLEAPDFEEIDENIRKLEKKDMIIGMFIAEALDTKEDLYYPDEDRDFDFSEMCRDGTKNFWGEHSCMPDLTSDEYQKYVIFITHEAMELGVQSFMFGQIYHQEKLENTEVEKVIKAMKKHADMLGIEIVVGAQTNDITDEDYLKLFDYIEGGTGLHPSGEIENGPCFSRWWKQPGDWCWALLWHEQFADKANNVFIHLDWSGKLGDDMSTLARMNDEKRIKTLKKLHKYFTDKGHGFLMPFMTALPKNNGGCYGEKERYYSANRKYDCDDEEEINEILKNKD